MNSSSTHQYTITTPAFANRAEVIVRKMENSHFNRLPGEIRNMIYTLVLYDPDGITLTFDGKTERFKLAVPSTCHNISEKRGIPAVRGLPATCRLLRREALQLVFSLNSVVFDTHHWDRALRPCSWMPAIDAWAWQVGMLNFQLIRHMTIDLGFLRFNQSIEVSSIFANHVLGLQALYGMHATVLLRVHTNVGFGPEGFVELAFCSADLPHVWPRDALPEIQRLGYAAIRRNGGPLSGKEALDCFNRIKAIRRMVSDMRLAFGFCLSASCCNILPFLLWGSAF